MVLSWIWPSSLRISLQTDINIARCMLIHSRSYLSRQHDVLQLSQRAGIIASDSEYAGDNLFSMQSHSTFHILPLSHTVNRYLQGQVIAIGIYRVTLHPLAKYPGPLLARLTSCYGAYWASRGVLHLNMWQNHQKYGSDVRIPGQKLSHTRANSRKHCTLRSQPAASKFEYWATRYDTMVDKLRHFDSQSSLDIYDHAKRVKKANAYRPIAQTMGRWTAFSTIDKYLYRRKRRVVHRWFSDDAIKTFSPRMLSLIRIFCAQLHKDDGATDLGWTKPRNMRDYCKPS